MVYITKCLGGGGVQFRAAGSSARVSLPVCLSIRLQKTSPNIRKCWRGSLCRPFFPCPARLPPLFMRHIRRQDSAPRVTSTSVCRGRLGTTVRHHYFLVKTPKTGQRRGVAEERPRSPLSAASPSTSHRGGEINTRGEKTKVHRLLMPDLVGLE